MKDENFNLIFGFIMGFIIGAWVLLMCILINNGMPLL